MAPEDLQIAAEVPLVAEPVPDIDLGHLIDECRELVLIPVGAHSANPARDLAPDCIERNPALKLTSRHNAR